MKRDIIFVTHHLGGIGGVQRVVDQLATRFAEDGNKVTVVGCAVQSQEKYEKGTKELSRNSSVSGRYFFRKAMVILKRKVFFKKIRKRVNGSFVAIARSNHHLSKPYCLFIDGKNF